MDRYLKSSKVREQPTELEKVNYSYSHTHTHTYRSTHGDSHVRSSGATQRYRNGPSCDCPSPVELKRGPLQ